MADYTRFTNLEVTGDLIAGTVDIDDLTADTADIGAIKAVAEDTDIVEVDGAASTAPTKAEFDALVDVVNALTADLGRATT